MMFSVLELQNKLLNGKKGTSDRCLKWEQRTQTEEKEWILLSWNQLIGSRENVIMDTGETRRLNTAPPPPTSF